MTRAVQVVLVLAGAAVVLGLVRTFSGGEVGRRAPSKFPERFPVRGIDVSHHNGVIEWAQVARGGISFVYVKASEGGDRGDPRFASNSLAARQAGLKVGAYHFFTFCRSGEDQAKQFLSMVKPGAGDLPPAVDVEFVGNCRDVPSREVVRANLDAWLARVEGSLGRRAVVYSTPDAADEFLTGLDRPLWMRTLPGEPRRDWTFWQFDPGGSVQGLEGPVDLDVFRGDRAALDAL